MRLLSKLSLSSKPGGSVSLFIINELDGVKNISNVLLPLAATPVLFLDVIIVWSFASSV